MKRRTRLAISIVSGVAAAAIALLYASSVRAEAAEAEEEALALYGGDLISVCVATRDIDPGETIDEENVVVEEWLAGMVPADAVTSLDDALGQTATSHIPENSVLSSTYFVRDEDAIEVPAGEAAVSVACDAEHAVGGALEQGDRVDVYVSKDGVSDLLVEAQVIDTNTLADGGGDLAWVTLAVGSSEVDELLAAATTGTITIVIPSSEAGADDSDEAEAAEEDSAEAESNESYGDEAAAESDEGAVITEDASTETSDGAYEGDTSSTDEGGDE